MTGFFLIDPSVSLITLVLWASWNLIGLILRKNNNLACSALLLIKTIKKIPWLKINHSCQRSAKQWNLYSYSLIDQSQYIVGAVLLMIIFFPCSPLLWSKYLPVRSEDFWMRNPCCKASIDNFIPHVGTMLQMLNCFPCSTLLWSS